jgi:DNA (cytosine-5)-methyltransferase 1
MKLTVGSLFSGIGGIDLGLERAGMEIRWQVEIDPWCRQVLMKHWPTVPKYGDIREIDETQFERVDVVAGGFPCQNISKASVARSGIDGPQSGLWAEFYRVICDLRPRYVLVENTAAITTAGLDRITGQLAEIGYDAEWDCLPAAAFGAPHIRDRFYLLAYPRSDRYGTPEETIFAGWSESQLHAGWFPKPAICGVDDGVSRRVDRLRGLGNAVVPQVVEHIGRMIVSAATAGIPTHV